MRILIGIMILISIGCGRVPVQATPGSLDYDPEVESYLNQYLEDASYYGKPVDETWLNKGVIKLRLLPRNIAGECVVYDNKAWEINLNITYWKDYVDTDRLQLMYHEFGHCLHDYDHRETKWYSWPASIMASTMINSWFFANHQDEYIQELFTGVFNPQ